MKSAPAFFHSGSSAMSCFLAFGGGRSSASSNFPMLSAVASRTNQA